MVIDAREPQILKRSSAQRLHQPNMGGSRINFAAGQVFEEQLQLECVHRSRSLLLCLCRGADSGLLPSPVFLTSTDPGSNIIDCAVEGFGASFRRDNATTE